MDEFDHYGLGSSKDGKTKNVVVRPCRVSTTVGGTRVVNYTSGRSQNPYRSLDNEILDNYRYGGPKSRSNTRHGHRDIVPSKRDPYSLDARAKLKSQDEGDDRTI